MAIIAYRVNALTINAALFRFTAISITAYFLLFTYMQTAFVIATFLSMNVITFTVTASLVRVAAADFSFAVYAFFAFVWIAAQTAILPDARGFAIDTPGFTAEKATAYGVAAFSVAKLALF